MKEKAQAEEGIFSAYFDLKPPDKPGLDFALRLKLGALEVVIPPRVIGRVGM